MKNVIFSFVLLGTVSPAFALEVAPVATCNKIALYGPGGFTASDINSIEVTSSEMSPSGYQATISIKGQSIRENDIELSLSDAQKFQEMASLLLPDVRWSEVTSARSINIGVKANREDGNGASIIQLLGQEQNLLGQMVTVGWGFGRCQ